MLRVTHVLRSQQFSVSCIKELFGRADDFHAGQTSVAHGGRIVFTVFYEPSTRTRFSFETAAARLGAMVVSTENAGEFSSAIKGESLEDTIRVLCGYKPDAIVLRHPQTGAAEISARVSEGSGVSIINAGDGAGQHPTQSLLDLYTIAKEVGGTGLKVVIGGDLANGRTARSLAYLLAKVDPSVRLVFVSPPSLRLGGDLKEHLCEHRVRFEESEELVDTIQDADVVYWTRIQKERIASGDFETLRLEMQTRYSITLAHLKLMKPTAILMHPLPRVGEIDPSVDNDPRAAYFRQAANGVPLRMAILERIFAGIPFE